MDKKICKTLFSEYAIPLKSWTYCTVITQACKHTHMQADACVHTHNIKVEEDGGTNGEREGLGEIIR